MTLIRPRVKPGVSEIQTSHLTVSEKTREIGREIGQKTAKFGHI